MNIYIWIVVYVLFYSCRTNHLLNIFYLPVQTTIKRVISTALSVNIAYKLPWNIFQGWKCTFLAVASYISNYCDLPHGNINTWDYEMSTGPTLWSNLQPNLSVNKHCRGRKFSPIFTHGMFSFLQATGHICYAKKKIGR